VPRQIICQSNYVIAAVAPEQGLMTSLILPRANTAMMKLFLAQVALDFADYFIVMQVDQASWHRSNELQVPENIRFNFQPAYFPLWRNCLTRFLKRSPNRPRTKNDCVP